MDYGMRKHASVQRFVGRIEDLQKLEEHLLPQRQHGQASANVFVLHGLGGVGKTQLASKFVTEHKWSFRSVAWLDASSPELLEWDLVSYGTMASAAEGVSANNILVGEARARGTAWLLGPENAGGLLVLDCVGGKCGPAEELDGSFIEPFLLGQQASILITTRLPYLTRIGPSHRLKTVDERTSWCIFKQWCTLENLDEASLPQLLELLAGLPLALAIVANFIEESGCSVSDCLKLYKKEWIQIMAGDAARAMSCLTGPNLHDIGPAWAGSVEAVRLEDPTAAQLLLLWACMGPGDIWYDIFRRACKVPVCPPWLAELCDEVRFLKAVKAILRRSLAEKTYDGAYTMHPVLAQYICSTWNGLRHEVLHCRRIALHLVAYAIPPLTSREDLAAQKRLLPHADNCAAWLENDESWSFPQTVDLIASAALLGDLYAEQGLLRRAESVYERALLGAANNALGSDPSTLLVKRYFARLLSRLHKYTEAETLSAEIMRCCQNLLRTSSCKHSPCQSDCALSLTAEVYADHAAICMRQNQFDESERLLDFALTTKKDVFGMMHSSTLDTIHDLGVLYTHQGHYDDAENQLNIALDGRVRLLGRNHPATLLTLSNLSMAKAQQGHLQSAEALCRQAIEGVEVSLDRLHDISLHIYRNMAHVFCLQKRFTEAAALFLRVKTDSEVVFGREHSATLQVTQEYEAALNGESDSRSDDAVSLVPFASSALAGREEESCNSSSSASGTSHVPDIKHE